MKLFRTIILTLIVGLLAVGVRADDSPGGDGSGGGGSGSPGGPGPTSHGGASRGAPGGPSGHERRAARSQDGSYSLIISGYYKGTGTATVTATSVSLSGTVKGPDGVDVPLSTDALTLSGPYFSGSGTIGSAKIQIKGKLDAAKASRLGATFETLAGNHAGRIFGTLPSDTGDANWNH
jgi:hypothetical protein